VGGRSGRRRGAADPLPRVAAVEVLAGGAGDGLRLCGSLPAPAAGRSVGERPTAVGSVGVRRAAGGLRPATGAAGAEAAAGLPVRLVRLGPADVLSFFATSDVGSAGK
jgi:hypothetical protein